MRQRTVWICIVCLLLLCSLTACKNSCITEPEPVSTPISASAVPQAPSTPETVTDEIVIGGGEEQPAATAPAQQPGEAPTVTQAPEKATAAPTNAPAATSTAAPSSTAKATAKTSAKPTATSTAKSTASPTADSDITLPEIGDDDPTPSAKATPAPTATPKATATSGAIELPPIP